MSAAHRANQFFAGGDQQRRRQIMPIGAAMAGQTGVHQAQAIEQFGAGAKGAADAGHAGTLVQCQGGRDIQNIINRSPGRLGHAAAGIGGKGLQIAAGAFGI